MCVFSHRSQSLVDTELIHRSFSALVVVESLSKSICARWFERMMWFVFDCWIFVSWIVVNFQRFFSLDIDYIFINYDFDSRIFDRLFVLCLKWRLNWLEARVSEVTTYVQDWRSSRRIITQILWDRGEILVKYYFESYCQLSYLLNLALTRNNMSE